MSKYTITGSMNTTVTFSNALYDFHDGRLAFLKWLPCQNLHSLISHLIRHLQSQSLCQNIQHQGL